MHSSVPHNATRADVIVVGAGTLGIFHAYFAACKGYKTLLLERNAFPNDASTRNFGMVLQTIVETDTDWTGCAHASAQIYRALQRGLVTGREIEEALALLDDPTFAVSSPVMMSAWGRRRAR